MKIEVCKILKNNLVQVNSEFGEFKAYMRTEFAPNQRSYDVELDFEDVVSKDDFSHSESKIERIIEDNQFIYITGIIDSIEDSVLFMKLKDSIIMFEFEDECIERIVLNEWITVRVSAVNMYSVD